MKEVQDLVLSCNKDGMESLRKASGGRHDAHLKAAFEQFKYAETILLTHQKETDNTALLAVTCNNLGCYYKKVGKYHGALSYLRRALNMEVELKTDDVTVASTHLNLCAILSKLEKHDKAVQHALCALDLMSKRVAQSDVAVSQDDYAVLAIAYHNVAMEREFLQQWEQAATAFQTGYQVAKRLLGENHPLSITLGKNAEVICNKTKTIKVKPPGTRSGRIGDMKAVVSEGGGLVLPPVLGMSREAPESPILLEKKNVRNEAVDWVKSEEALWTNFAQKALRIDGTAGAPVQLASGGAILEADEQLAQVAIATPRRLQPLASKAPDTVALHAEALHAPGQARTQAEFGQVLDSNPEALMDIIEADGHLRTSLKPHANDFRPHKSMKRSTRTSRVVRRAGVFNSTTHRDRVQADIARKRQVVWSAAAQKAAAERIQRFWRSWYQYCQENAEWMTVRWICATMIQSHWRSYHVRRQRQDAAATKVQRHIRGYLVRRALKRNRAATNIQRIVIGMLTRKKLKTLHDKATHVQRFVRGHLARKRCSELRSFKFAIVVTIQRHIRAWMAKRIAHHLAEEKRHRLVLWNATVDLQRLFRGWKGRQRAHKAKLEYLRTKREYEAATRVQNVVRGRRARKRVNLLRELRMQEMEKAATFLRKVWIGVRTRKKYLQLQQEFKLAEGKIITIQRYMRGCMCRLKMWREAVRTEEELWAAVEIQRSWRGYRGRVLWEQTYEVMWRREMSAALIQRNVRGWLARLRVSRKQRRIARAEFERARERFRAAQKLQALVRGVLNRKRTRLQLARAVHAATQIQRIARGRAVRKRMWQQVIHQRATLIVAAGRGFLVRRRRMRLAAKVICIQRAYRRWLKLHPREREQRRQKMLVRKAKATIVQRHFRKFAEHKALQRISASTT